jgi:hypothetical protein
MASVVCYVHDAVCQCCEYGILCGHRCRKELACDNEAADAAAEGYNNDEHYMPMADEPGSGEAEEVEGVEGSGDTETKVIL